jgi:hypothetical protein
MTKQETRKKAEELARQTCAQVAGSVDLIETAFLAVQSAQIEADARIAENDSCCVCCCNADGQEENCGTTIARKIRAQGKPSADEAE